MNRVGPSKLALRMHDGRNLFSLPLSPCVCPSPSSLSLSITQSEMHVTCILPLVPKLKDLILFFVPANQPRCRQKARMHSSMGEWDVYSNPPSSRRVTTNFQSNDICHTVGSRGILRPSINYDARLWLRRQLRNYVWSKTFTDCAL